MTTDMQDTGPPSESNGHARALFIAKMRLAHETEATITYPPLRGAAREPTLDRELAPYVPPAPAVDNTDRAGAQSGWAAADAVALAARLRILAKFGIPPSPPACMHMAV